MKRLITIIVLGLGVFATANAADDRKQVQTAPKKNILWIYCEDLSPWMESYGYPVNAGKTPALDQLSANGVRFSRAYVPAPVCSACRSAMITGLYQTTTGTHNHRSSRTPESAIHLPKGIKTLPQIFQEHGYETFNRGKDDYNFVYKRSEHYTIGNPKSQKGFYGKSGRGHWTKVPKGKPWFGQIQLGGGKTSTKKLQDKVDPSSMKVPPYFPDEEIFRKEWAHHYDTVRVTDRHVAGIMEKLKADGMLDNTVVFFFSDHGNNHSLRHKQFCYEGGVHVPLIISGPGIPKNAVRTELMSMLDVSATSLALAGIPIPDYFDGQNLFAADYKKADYVISARDRLDYSIDRIRTVRTENFRYIRNFLTDRILLQPQYRDVQAPTKRLRELHASGKLGKIPEWAFFGKRPAEELYDLAKDPHQINNLASDPKFATELKRHREILTDWIKKTDDKGQYPESRAGLEAVLKRWGKKCVNPEFDIVKNKGEKTTSTKAEDTDDTLTLQQIDAYQTDGRWLGPGWWGNRLHDWSISKKQITCSPERPFLAWRVAHDTTRNLDASAGKLNMSVDLAMMSKNGPDSKLAPDALVGVLLGAGYSMDSPMARLLMFGHATAKNKKWPSVPGSGYAIGLDPGGTLKMIDLDNGNVIATATEDTFSRAAKLQITAEPEGDMVKITARSGGKKATAAIPASRYRGGLGLFSHPGTRQKGCYTLNSSFSNYSVKGGHRYLARQAIGPVACVQYTIDRGVLKLSAQCMPLPQDTEVELHYRPLGKEWQTAGKKNIHAIDKNALFRIENWDSSQSASYRVLISLPGLGQTQYSGMIAAEPTSGKLRLAALGCIIHRPWGAARNWNDVLYFPHHDLQKRVAAQKPDVVFFYGDQMYEGTPSPVDAKNIHEDYLYKWLFHCIAFRETIRNVPSITIPDDHDVYQGNHWGEGARKAPDRDWNNGGYRFPGEFIAQVHRTQTSHLPDAFEPDCLEQNIPAYHCDWNWGGVSFAILGDRYFKSGPAGHGLPKSGTNRPDHYNNPEFDTADLDLPGLELLGKPQEKFLAHWAADWSHGAKLKAVLSQSPFGNLATHHSGQYLIADLDGNGWPQSGRKRALRLMRSARAPHIAGDQHLSTMVQHGIDHHGDAVFSFTAPAVSNAYARAFHPSFKGNYYKTTPPAPSEYLGERLDGFKNKVTFLAVANPDTRPDGPYTTKHLPKMNQQVPGFGVVDFDTNTQTVTFHSLPRSEEVASKLKGGEYPGWPVTVKIEQNDGRKPVGELARVSIKGKNPVVRVYGPDGTLQWAQRMGSDTFTVNAYAPGKHKVEVGSGDVDAKWHTFEAEPADQAEEVKISLP